MPKQKIKTRFIDDKGDSLKYLVSILSHLKCNIRQRYLDTCYLPR